jgi:hypothetical protein
LSRFHVSSAAPAGELDREAAERRPTVEVAEELVTMDSRLRFALFGLECAPGVSFAGVECEREFRDCAEDQVSAKRYTFFESPRLAVTGRVDEYEPESLWMQVRGERGSRELLRRGR